MSVNPVQLLYHGTSLDNAEIIEQQGIVKKNHDKVYLTSDILVAYDYANMRVNDVSSNSFKPVICIVDAPQMVKDGFVFEHNIVNAEWTVDNVPAQYILQFVIEEESELELLAHYVHEVSKLNE